MCCWLPLTHKFTTFKVHFKKFILIYLKPVILIKNDFFFSFFIILFIFLHYFACIIIILCVCVCDVCADVCMCMETRGGAVPSLCSSLPYSPETGSLTDLYFLSWPAALGLIPLRQGSSLICIYQAGRPEAPWFLSPHPFCPELLQEWAGTLGFLLIYWGFHSSGIYDRRASSLAVSPVTLLTILS